MTQWASPVRFQTSSPLQPSAAHPARMNVDAGNSTAASQQTWLAAKLLPLLILLLTGTVSTLLAQHIIDRVSNALGA